MLGVEAEVHAPVVLPRELLEGPFDIGERPSDRLGHDDRIDVGNEPRDPSPEVAHEAPDPDGEARVAELVHPGIGKDFCIDEIRHAAVPPPS